MKLLREELGDAPARRLLEAANAAPERCLRANRLRGGLPAAREALRVEGFSSRGVDGLPDALLYDGPPLERSGAFRDGLVTAQSRGSQIAAIVAAGGVTGPDAAVLDLCAAPGAKTSQLAALLPGAALTAVEVDEERADDLRRNLARLGADHVDVVRADALDPHPEWEATFDAVLLDAPCSGLGTLASRADLRWRRHLNDVPRLAQLQARLLARAAAAVKPGGALTYAVCTLTRAETLGVVEPLLGGGGWTADDLGAAWPGLAHPAAGGFLLVLPPDGGSSGFFVARLRRAARRGRPASRGPRGGVDYRCGTTPRRPRIGGDRWKTSCGASTWHPRSCPRTSAAWAPTSRPCSTPAPASSTSTSWTATSCPTSPSGRWW